MEDVVRAEVSECPARTVYDTLASEARLTPERYRELIDALRPLWIEDVVCPVHVAVRHLRAAALAVATGQDADAKASHEAARTHLHTALGTVGLLTVEEEVQDLVVDRLLRDDDSSANDGHTLQGWGGWRRSHGG